MITKQTQNISTPISAKISELKMAPGLIHSMPMSISFKNLLYLCPPPPE